MTAKERIYEIMDSLPDGVTFEDALYELYVASKIERGLEQAERGEGIPHEEAKQQLQLLHDVQKGLEEAERCETVPHEEAKQMIDEWLQLSAKEEILTLLAGLPDAPTYADAFDRLRPLYYRHVAPIIAQYGNPPGPSGQWRRDITGAEESEAQKRVKADKAELLRLMRGLPDAASATETVDEAMYELVLSYYIETAGRQMTEGKGIPWEEVQRRLGQPPG